MPDTARVWTPVEGDYGGTHASDPAIIAHVRFDRYTGMARNGYVMTEGAQGLLFVDARTSSGAFAVPVGSLVQIGNGEKMEAVRVNEFAGFAGRVHHWEIELR